MPSERVQRQIDRLLDQAEEAIERADWNTVIQHSNSVQAIDPDNEDAFTYLEAAERSLQSGISTENSEETSEPLTPASDHPAQESIPSSFSGGRYQVKRFLGEGGKKKVYLAHDELLDRDVAFALIKTEGLDEVSRTRISREAQAMGRLGSHPHIVTVFDLGQHPSEIAGTQPYMVTELMGGGDVEGIVEDAPDHKLPLEQAISIAVETCRGLEFAQL